MARYDFNQLDPQSFTELCNALLLRVISERVTPGPLLGPDAGIDAYYQGPGKGDWSALDGSWIFQYKFHNVARQGVDMCRRVVRRDVERELEKVFREYRHCANNYILITNVPYAPTPGSAARKWLDGMAALYIAPVREELPRDAWIQIAEDRNYLGSPTWSPDGKLIYYESSRDDHYCVWVQRITAEGQPDGAPVGTLHLHESIQSRLYGGAPFGITSDSLYILLQEFKGNAWMVNVDQ